jgi:hypothetical protein
MDVALLLLLGFEVDRFAGEDDSADALTSSLEALEGGGWSLSPYQGPAIQPYVGLRGDRWQVQLAAGIATHHADASSSDGRTERLRTTQGALELSAQLTPGLWLVGLDAGVSGGRARLDGSTIATGAPFIGVGPTVGMRVPVHPNVDLVGRARWQVQASDGDLSSGLGGALAVELHR